MVGGGEHYPKTGKPSFDDTGKVLTVPVTLRPGWAYSFWLNSSRFQNFISTEGEPLLPVHVEFKTRAQ